jgi:DNA-binding PadR family transcriptional regulator
MGFVTSLDLRRFQEKHRMNDILDNLLTMLVDGEMRTTLKFIDECKQADVASFGTAHKYLQRLKANGFVTETTVKDGRVKLLRISDSGREYLQRWSTGDEL